MVCSSRAVEMSSISRVAMLGALGTDEQATSSTATNG